MLLGRLPWLILVFALDVVPGCREPGPPPGWNSSANESEPTLDSLGASVSHDHYPSATAWAHYQAGEYLEAVPYFARVSAIQPSEWTHPFNLACAAALAGDEQLAKLGLTEAVARDREATASRARSHVDLVTMRDKPWFEPTLRGE